MKLKKKAELSRNQQKKIKGERKLKEAKISTSKKKKAESEQNI